MSMQESVYPGWPEDPALTGTRIEEQVVGHIAELAAEPGSKGHPESHLAARENVRGKTGGHGALQDVLAGFALQLERARDGPDELQQSVVQQGHPAFERDCHA